ncbi:MAG: [Bacteroidales bacterium]|nr:[FeFe] hydrogenase H-cluster maturation GTPase HydF [Bacteroidales bacterium]
MDRLHIAFFGPVNSGKSSLINALAGQEVSLVSPIPGTTTDPVRKAIELPGLGPCVLIDTAGLDDGSLLGSERERRTRDIVDETDIAVVLVTPVSQKHGHRCQKPGFFASGVPNFGTPDAPPVIYVSSKCDLGEDAPEWALPVSTVTGEGIGALLERMAEVAPKEEQKWLTGKLVKPGDCVLLVMPQDSEAPKGRLILPQVQVLRELLDRGCNALCCTPESLQSALGKVTPDLVITDSQVFALVNAAIPAEMPLTSFSVLLAAAKGDIATFVEGASAIDRLTPNSRVLIAEACTHVPDSEDIGRVKIPALLRASVDPGSTGSLTIDIAAGNDFPEDLAPYDLIIHCGACVATKTLVRSRIRKALLAGVPITNYGIALAKLQGILDRIQIPR